MILCVENRYMWSGRHISQMPIHFFLKEFRLNEISIGIFLSLSPKFRLDMLMNMGLGRGFFWDKVSPVLFEEWKESISQLFTIAARVYIEHTLLLPYYRNTFEKQTNMRASKNKIKVSGHTKQARGSFRVTVRPCCPLPVPCSRKGRRGTSHFRSSRTRTSHTVRQSALHPRS